MNGHDAVVELLLANKAEIDARNENGGQPVHYGACYGHRHIVELLIASKADVNSRDHDTVFPLHCAAYGGYKDVVALLLRNGADIDARDKDGDTALHAAVRSGYPDVAELLLASGAHVDVRTTSLGLTPLDEAAAYGRSDSWFLVKSWFGDNTQAVRSRYLTALLLDHGSDAKAKGREGSTPLHLAAFWGNADAAELLLNRGADANAKDAHGRTPLEMAGSSRIKELLRKHGALG
jgi:ankyrin repeat protein